MKYIIIVPDGMADNPMAELQNKTPLEVARTTNMDYLAKHGTQGLLHSIPKGMAPGSEIGNLSLLGYRPDKYFTGRAPLEAANLGIDLADNQIAFRCNLVALDETIMRDYSAGHISNEEAATLIEALNQQTPEDNVRFYAGKSYRHLMILTTHSVKQFAAIRCTPPHDIIGKDIQKYLPKGGNEALFLLKLMERSRDILGKHPINQVRVDLGDNPGNAIWLWGQGIKPQLPSFQELYGLKGAIISAVDLVNGIGRLAGLEIITVPGATGYYDTNYKGKAEYALAALKNNDFVFIHIEAPDEAGHNGDAKAKIAAIEAIDQDIVGTVLNHFGPHDEVRIMVLPDHPTPVELRTHTSEPVPLVMYGKGIAHNGQFEYNERSGRSAQNVFN
ncbi:MAG TPA: cofactor-independent phosphoglycerate mutase, partial [Candidatus Bathyarchaeia archaeon]|nr:cofactor-independent phosphoglycerate mutase [Candidatus Bathyarchaeia archaeon]